jgi:hypothetical protein
MSIIIRITERGADRYEARLDDGCVLVKSTGQPFLGGARALLTRGVDPGDAIVRRRVGSDVDA